MHRLVNGKKIELTSEEESNLKVTWEKEEIEEKIELNKHKELIEKMKSTLSRICSMQQISIQDSDLFRSEIVRRLYGIDEV